MSLISLNLIANIIKWITLSQYIKTRNSIRIIKVKLEINGGSVRLLKLMEIFKYKGSKLLIIKKMHQEIIGHMSISKM